MVRQWMASFETQGALTTVGTEPWAGGGTSSYQTGCRGVGSSLQLDSGAGNSGAAYLSHTPSYSIGGTPTTYMRAWIYVPSSSGWPTTDCTIYDHGFSAAGDLTVVLLTTGSLRFTCTSGTADYAIAQNTWYRLETKGVCGTGAACEFRLDGTTRHTGTWTTSGTTPFLRCGLIGAPGANKAIRIDDMAYNDSTGSANTGWCGDGQIVELIAASDVSRGNWVAGAGGTTSLFEAMNNKPPVGVVLGSATDTSQIKNIVSGTSAAEFDTVSYTSVGIAAADTLVAVATHVVLGESATLMTGTVQLSSNPVEGPLDAVENYWSSSTAGTYATGWGSNGFNSTSHFKQAIANAPSVTLASGARVKLTKTSANTNATMCCYLSVLVEYQPSVAPVPIAVHLIGSTL